MKPFLLRKRVIVPALRVLENVSANYMLADHRAQVLMIAIALQESRAKHRFQIGGPARGFWQFEKGGGCAGVLRHEASKKYAHALLSELDIAPTLDAVWDAIPYSELLAAGFARLLLWTHPKPLPMAMPANEQHAWDYYLNLWRPGKPHPEVWPQNWAEALRLCGDF